MPFMTWNDRISVGVAAIDDDHKRLIGITNELYDAIVARRGKEVLGRLLDEIVVYTEYHFDREERFFDATGYPDAFEHKQQHSDFARQVRLIRDRYKSGSVGLTLEVMNFLKDWLFDHILGSDARFGPYLNSMGIR
jgi:hemerythrin-like metal-binding protein